MSTIVKITNEGPENALIIYYNEVRAFKAKKEILTVGASIVVTVWDGNLPVVLPAGSATKSGNNFYAVPPAHY